MTPQRPERFQKTSRNFTDAGRLNTPMSTANSIPTMLQARESIERFRRSSTGCCKLNPARSERYAKTLHAESFSSKKQHHDTRLQTMTCAIRKPRKANLPALARIAGCAYQLKRSLSHTRKKIQRRLVSGPVKSWSCGQVFARGYLSAQRRAARVCASAQPFSAQEVKTL